jgi:23S rRNA pseudouridine1911/1915/1917 synthase
MQFTMEQAGARLDRAVASHVPGVSRAQVQRLIKTGSVSVNGRPSKASYQTQVGDVIAVFIPDDAEEAVVAEAIPLDIVFEDGHLLVVNKPAGMVVHPALGHRSGTLVNALLAHCPEIAHVGGIERAGIVHRLDRNTSGLLVVAKDEESRKALQRQFKRRQVEKVYMALVEGRLAPREGIVDAPIGRDRSERKRMAVVRSGREARTRYRVTEYLGDHALLEVRPKTGRTHQIRVHLAWIGHPVVGDAVYGSRRQRLLHDRHFLHASRLGFVHPTTAQKVAFEAPLPGGLERLLARLRTSR